MNILRFFLIRLTLPVILLILPMLSAMGQEAFRDLEQEATLFFQSKSGIDSTNLYRIDVDSISENIILFNFLVRPSEYEVKDTGFVLMGKMDSQSLVLAYSDTRELNVESVTIKRLLRSYQEQIDTLKSRELPFVNVATNQNECKPLLGDIEWGQGMPYNNFLPINENGDRYLLGCMATAMGQIMCYHQYPETGENHSLFINHLESDAPSVMIDYSDYNVDWKQVNHQYLPKDSLEARVDICELLYYCALSVGAEFSSNGTSATIVNAHQSFLQHFKYHPKAALLDGVNTPPNVVLSSLYRELNQKRPIMVSSFGHAFLCDGYQDNYFHLNWGWYGQCNGYYLFSLLPENGQLCMPENAIVDLFPRTQQPDVSLSVTMEVPGTLKDKLPLDDELWKVSDLKVTGPLNGKDITLLRQMAGAKQGWENGGTLQYLDLKGASFVYDSTAVYFNRDLKREHAVYTYSQTVNGVTTSKEYDFEHLTKQEWDEFCMIQNNLDGPKECLYFTKNEDYYEGLLVQNNEVGSSMFKDCISLRRVVLPDSVKVIGYEAFRGCFLLRELTLPIALERVESSVFSRCTMLDCLNLNEMNPSLTMVEGALYTKDMKRLICYLPYYRRTHFRIPDSVEEIRDYAFADNLFLSDIQLPPHIKYIPNGLFYKCMSLKHVNVPVGVVEVKNWAFSYCRSLVDVYIPSTVTYIGEEAFSRCHSLERIYCFPDLIGIHPTSNNELQELEVEICEIVQ